MEKWTTIKIQYLKENYTTAGNIELSQKLKMSTNSIRHQLKKLSLKRDNKYEKINFSLNNLIDLYIMGFFWADGYLHESENKLELSILTEDFNDIHSLFDIKKWSIRHRIRTGRKSQTTIGVYKKETCNIFKEKYNYIHKSLECPNFISKIPNELLHYFIRGFFDGDGCFYISKNGKQKQCYLCGSYEQNWMWIEKIFNELNIKYTIKRKIQNINSKYSIIYINKNSIGRFGKYIYEDYETDKIGLKRKYEKFILINQ